MMLAGNDYALIQFNNGLHSWGSDLEQRERALPEVLKLLREAQPGATIIWASTTPCVSPDNTRLVKAFNEIAARVMAENGIPVNDLFALMDPLDRGQYWTDNCHHAPEGRKLAAKQVADVIRAHLGADGAPGPEATAPAAAGGPAGAARRGGADRMDWTKVFWYDADKDQLPRVLVIGDSIYDDYQRSVNKALAGTAYLSTYSTSRSFADPRYGRELDYILDEYAYDVILFNTGLHCNTHKTDPLWETVLSDIPGWETGLRGVLQRIRAKGKGARIVWAGSVPWHKAEIPAEVRELNAVAARVMEENKIPIADPPYSAIGAGPQYTEELVARVASTLSGQLGVTAPSGASTNAGMKAASSPLGPTGRNGQ
jgi:hypothetical protein